MKHICFFNSLSFWGGGEKFHHEFAKGFLEKAYRVTIISHPDSPLSLKAKDDNIPLFGMRVGKFSFLNPIKIRKLKKYFRAQQIDTLFISTSEDLKLAGIAARRAGIKKIIYRRGLAVSKKNNYLNRWLFTKVVSGIIANSEDTKIRFLENLKEVIHPDKIRVIYNGIAMSSNDNDFSIAEIEDIKKHRKGVVLGNAGRLTAQKGHHLLVKVAELLNERELNFSMFIAGSGELYDELARQIKVKNLQEKVFLLGFVQDIPNFMRSLDVFVFSSLWEGFGYVLTEAMIQKKPVVAFNCSSNPEVVDDGETGLLVKTGNVSDMADAIEKLILDGPLRNRMGAAGKDRVITQFNFQHQLDKLEKYLLEE